LRNYYAFDRIPSNYFNLPPPKKPLPTAYQDLEPTYRLHFSIDLQDSDTKLTEIIQMLREDYFFERLPNDYFIAKPNLPRATNKI
jgi:hypothetical protein